MRQIKLYFCNQTYNTICYYNLMDRIILLLLLIVTFDLKAQDNCYVQIPNSDFEKWDNIDTKYEEPDNWHSFKTSTGPFHHLLMQQVERYNDIRPGSNGKYSARIFSRSIVGITANGNLTNGRLNAGSMFPAGAKNNNYTQRDSEFCTVIGVIPDSLTVWVRLTTKDKESCGRIMSYVHGDADFVCLTGGWEPYDMLCAQVEYEFLPTEWKRLSLPFKDYTHLCNEPRYILTSFTTNKKAGEGDAGDEMLVDDLFLIYNPSLECVIISDQFAIDEIEIEYVIKGTMSPPNLNLPPNDVVVTISMDENFNDSVEIGRKTTDRSGTMKCKIPDVFVGKDYMIRVQTTNYPMECLMRF